MHHSRKHSRATCHFHSSTKSARRFLAQQRTISRSQAMFSTTISRSGPGIAQPQNAKQEQPTAPQKLFRSWIGTARVHART